jgi:hemoglobin-like flavoprotein
MSESDASAVASHAASVDRKARELVRKSFEGELKESMRSGELTSLFYGRLFELSPAVHAYFSGANMKVLGKALAGIIVVVVKGLDDLDVLLPKLLSLGKRHCIYGVEEQHYAEVGPALLFAMEKVLGEPLPEETANAWCGVLDVVVGIMLQGHAMAADEEHTVLKGRRRSRMFVLKPRSDTYFRLTRTHLVSFEAHHPVVRELTAYSQIRSMELSECGKRLRIFVHSDIPRFRKEEAQEKAHEGTQEKQKEAGTEAIPDKSKHSEREANGGTDSGTSSTRKSGGSGISGVSRSSKKKSSKSAVVVVDHSNPEELQAWMDEIQWRISASRRGYREDGSARDE